MIRRRHCVSLRVCVLAGGQSPERSISLASGRHVAESLAAAGHLVTCIDPIAADSPQAEAELAGPTAFRPLPLDEVEWSAFDLVFLALHGGAGEDGRVQRFFEDRQVPFTGPGCASAQLAMSKRATKRTLQAAGVPTLDDASFDAGTPFDLLAAQAAALGFPVIVKPEAQGSSLGVGVARDLVELAACRDASLLYDRGGLIEPFIGGREFTVAVVGRRALPVVEVLSAGPVLSYADKYSPGEHCRIADDLSGDQFDSLCHWAISTADALDTRGLVRIDMRFDTAGEPWVLELNAIPGMTRTSLAPFAARAAGWAMPDLCDHLARQCLDEFSYDWSRHDRTAAAA